MELWGQQKTLIIQKQHYYSVRGELKKGDQYLLCSDGLTDMLTNLEISEIMCSATSAEECVQNLVDSALEKGGRDNVTAIVCRIC